MRSAVAKFGIVSFVIAALVARAASVAGIVVDEEIFGTKEAAEMLAKARAFDPNSCPRERANREKAVALYKKAMELQPGAKMNAWIAARIAQLYAYYEDRKKGARADDIKAMPWWERCIGQLGANQILWAEAQAGLASGKFLTGDPKGAAEAFGAILTIDPDHMELPDWRVWPDDTTPRGKMLRDRELQKVRNRAHEARVHAVESVYYVLIRYDGAEALSAMLDIAERYPGTPVADRASQILSRASKAGNPSAYRYRGLRDAITQQLERMGESLPVPVETKAERAPVREARLPVPSSLEVGEATGFHRPPATTGQAGSPGNGEVASTGAHPGGSGTAMALAAAAVAALFVVIVVFRRAAVARRMKERRLQQERM